MTHSYLDYSKVMLSVDREYDTDRNDCFGAWISCLFYARKDFSLDENKEAFFLLVRKLLEDGYVKFLRPGADVYISPDNPTPRFTVNDPEAHWDASAEDIISYLRDRWPSVSDSDDLALTVYFYEIPGIIWRQDDGSYYGS